MEVRQTLGGRYKLLNELGSGGMAVVWRARDEVLGRPVAVKVLAGRYAGDPQSRARIRDEARAAANLSHPNIAQVYDYGEAENRPYVVMELINGPTLQQRVASAPLPPRTVFRICGEVAAGLAAAHAEGLVHRDIKMANIMVTPAGAKVVDFGIAAVAGPAAPEEMLVGTPAYLAPERLTGDVVQPASDVYALGVLLYRLLADESPWSVESTTQMLKAHVYIEPAPLPPLPGVPSAVATLISDCLRKDPQARPTASRVSSILADAAEALPEVRGKAAAGKDRRAAGALASIHGAEAGAGAGGDAADASGDAAGAGSGVAGAVGGAAAGVAGAGSEGAAASGGDADAPADDLHAETGLFVPDRARMSNERARAADQRGPDDPHRPGNRREPGDPRRPENQRAEGGAARPPDGVGKRRDAGSRGAAVASNMAATKIGPVARPAHPGATPAGSGGGARAGGVPLGKRKLAVAGVATVIAAALVAWLLIGDDTANRPDAAAEATTSAAPARNGGLGATAPSATSAAGAANPAGAEIPGRAVITGSGPAASVPTSGSTGTGSAPAAQPVPSASASTSESPSAAPQGKRLTSPGGAVRAVCANGKATLTSWEPADGYEAEKVVPGPALAPQIIFKGAKNRYRMTVTCVAGAPTPVVLPL